MSLLQFGAIGKPEVLNKFEPADSGGIGQLLNLFLNILVVAGGVYALFNLVLAGYAFLGAGDDPKKMEAAWAKIWQTLVGLAFVAGAFVLAAIFGLLIFGDDNAILEPTIKGL